MTESQEVPVLPYRTAFIIDGVVQDVINTDLRLSAIFLSDPVIVDVTNQEDSYFITSGYLYNQESNTFSIPEPEENDRTDFLIEGEGTRNVVED
jgi:hypothetical protein